MLFHVRSVETDHRSNWISIRVFSTILRLKQDVQDAILHSRSTEILTENMALEKSGLSIGHLLSTTARTCRENWYWLGNGPVNYSLVQFRDCIPLCSQLNLRDVRIFTYDELVITRLEALDASQIVIFLIRVQSRRLKTTVGSFGTTAFDSWQSLAFANMREYTRNRFVLMDRIRQIAEPVFPFPDMRSSDSRIIAFIRSEFKLVPCEYRCAVKISSGFMRCCKGFQQNIAGHLPGPISVDIRLPIEEFRANQKPNSLRLPNRDLRPVIQNT
jgi:hypothetical protein